MLLYMGYQFSERPTQIARIRMMPPTMEKA